MLGQRNGNPRSYIGRSDVKDSRGYKRGLLYEKMRRKLDKIGYDETVEWINGLGMEEVWSGDYIKREYLGNGKYGKISEKDSIKYMRRDLLEVLKNW